MATAGTPYEGREDEYDLGDGCSFTWLTDSRGVFGLIEHHSKPATAGGLYCGGYVAWRQPDSGGTPRHQLVAGGPGDEEHLTLSPSLLCRTCGNHGHISGGKWVPA